jgi:hypothetical protein
MCVGEIRGVPVPWMCWGTSRQSGAAKTPPPARDYRLSIGQKIREYSALLTCVFFLGGEVEVGVLCPKAVRAVKCGGGARQNDLCFFVRKVEVGVVCSKAVPLCACVCVCVRTRVYVCVCDFW